MAFPLAFLAFPCLNIGTHEPVQKVSIAVVSAPSLRRLERGGG
jgi:hypothetical protein